MVIASECGEGSSQESENGRLSRLEAKLDHLVLKVDGLAGMQQQQQQHSSGPEQTPTPLLTTSYFTPAYIGGVCHRCRALWALARGAFVSAVGC